MDQAQADMTVALFCDALDKGNSSAEILREWSASYPELEPEFASIVVERQLGVGAEMTAESAVDAEFTAMMARIVGEMDKERATASPAIDTKPASSTVSTLRSAAADRGLRFPEDLAKALRLPDRVLETISDRKIDIATLPSVLVNSLADLLNAASSDVVLWLRGSAAGPLFATGMVRERRAVYGARTSFSDLIAGASEIDEADRAYWQSVIEISRTIDEE